jgi:hypothetical protein
VLVYPSGIDVSTSTLRYLSACLRIRRQERRTRWRRLTVGRQALLVLAHLRCGHTNAQLAAGFDIGTTTAYRYIAEAVGLLAALAPTLAEAVKTASNKAFVILDGTLLPIDRIAADRPFYSGKHKKHGMNVQVITDPVGQLIWASPLTETMPRQVCQNALYHPKLGRLLGLRRLFVSAGELDPPLHRAPVRARHRHRRAHRVESVGKLRPRPVSVRRAQHGAGQTELD